MHERAPALSQASPTQQRLTGFFLVWLSWILLGYALLGRGFAYCGFAPLYIGEITLVLGLAALAWVRGPGAILTLAPAYMLVALMIWCAVRTAPYVAQFRMDALRDAAFWYYGFFAFIVAALLVKAPAHFKALLIRYRRFAVLFVCMAWLVFLARRLGILDVRFPGAPVSMGTTKGGDILVHLAGATAFILVGMARPNWWVVMLIAVNFLVVGVTNRSGMVAFVCATLTVFVLKPVRLKIAPLLYGVLCTVALLGLVNPTIRLHNRTLSLEQLWLNVKSVVDESGTTLDKTKEWRLSWWKDIAGYTFRGPFFWTGKGFGVNLADEDGYQVTHDKSLRNPHNAHITLLARAGVPGLALWVFSQLAWAWFMVRAYLWSRRRGDCEWAGIFVFLLAYWAAFIVNASFDVFIEGPMGGIWFWTLFGTGIAAVHIHRQCPDVIRT